MSSQSKRFSIYIDRSQRILKSKPDLFSVHLVRKRHSAEPGSEALSRKCYRHIVPELAALTLQPNWRLMKIVAELDRFLDFQDMAGRTKSGLPKDGAQDEWISRLIRTSDLPEDVKDAKRRAAWRDRVIGFSAKAEGEPREHIAVRAFPVRYLVPQKTAKSDNFLLLVAFHLTGGWFSAFICRLRQEYQPTYGKQVELDKRADSTLYGSAAGLGKRVLLERDWQKFLVQLKAAADLQDDELGRVTLHLPNDAHNLKLSLSTQAWHVANDMPSTYAGPDRFVIQRRRARKPCWDKLQLPEHSWGEGLTKTELDRLPALTGMTHPEKDVLINRLWTELVELRARSSSR